MKHQRLRLVLISSILSLSACRDGNPEACATHPDDWCQGGWCERGRDQQGREWSRCVPFDGGGPGPAADSGAPVDSALADAGAADVAPDAPADAMPVDVLATDMSTPQDHSPVCSSDNPASCGSSCITCPAVANANATCRAGVCGFECMPQHERCASSSACQRVSWDFESGSSEGWTIKSSTPPTTGSVAAGMAHGGQHAFRYRATLDQSLYASLVNLGRQDLCGGSAGGGVNVQGRTLSAWFYIAGPDVDPNMSSCTVIGFAGSDRQGNAITPPPRGQWFQVRDQLTNAANAKLDSITVACNLVASDPAAAWDVYVDDITID